MPPHSSSCDYYGYYFFSLLLVRSYAAHPFTYPLKYVNFFFSFSLVKLGTNQLPRFGESVQHRVSRIAKSSKAAFPALEGVSLDRGEQSS